MLEWRNFDFVEAIGFDPLVAEIERLKLIAPVNHDYRTAYVTGPEGAPNRKDSWFQRASFWRAHEALDKDHIKEVFNSGAPVVYSENNLTLDEFFKDKPVHFIKTDTDGFDMQALRGAEKTLVNAMGVLCEANFHAYGVNTTVWRDIDAFLVKQGLALANMGLVRYTRAALPGEFVSQDLANTRSGAIAWADCLYLRDPQELEGEHLIRLAITAEIYGLPDVSAEALVRFGEQAGREKVEMALDALVRYSPFPDAGSYEQLMERFEKDPRSFGPKKAPPPT